MRIRSIDVSESDKKSARLFFSTLTRFYDVGAGEALDMFARDGALTVSSYAWEVARLDVWELCEEHRSSLERFKPREIRIGCSYLSLAACKCRYDLVVIDTPQGIHEDWAGRPRIEHFDVMRQIGSILKDRALIVLYVNKQPYDRDELGSHGYDEYASYDFDKWMEARGAFYGVDPRDLTEEHAIAAYRSVLARQGLQVRSTLVVPCHSDVAGKEPYAFRLGLEVSR